MGPDKTILTQLSDTLFLSIVCVAVLVSIPFLIARDWAERHQNSEMADYRIQRDRF